MSRSDQPNTTSSYSAEWVASYFDEYGIREWDRLARSPVDEVSLHIHTHYLKEYTLPGARILEVGAGAGCFTQVLAGLGARVVVADISQVQLDLNRQHAQQHGFAHAVEDWRQVDICDMACFESESFDCVVAYGGPLSYVLERRDQALRECMRVLSPDGTLLLSVMSLWGSAHCHLRDVLLIPAENNRQIIESGDLLPETQGEGGHYCHMFRAGELCELLTQAGLTLSAMSASNCLSLGWDEFLQEIRADDEKWTELLRMELEACAEEACLGMGTHLIAVARKS